MVRRGTKRSIQHRRIHAKSSLRRMASWLIPMVRWTPLIEAFRDIHDPGGGRHDTTLGEHDWLHDANSLLAAGGTSALFPVHFFCLPPCRVAVRTTLPR